jgi:excisionase family DNA binding protein
MTSTLDEALRAAVREVVREELLALRGAQPPAPAVPPARTSTAATSEYVSTAEAAALACVRPATVRTWIRQGRLRGHRAGRLVRVRLDELRAYLARATCDREGVIDLDARARDILTRPRGQATRRNR